MPKAPRTRAAAAAAAARPDPLKAKKDNGNASKKKASAATKGQSQSGTSSAAVGAHKSKQETVSPQDNYLLLARLNNSFNPCISRLLLVPSHYNFITFHNVLQIAFGWANCHAHSFNVRELLGEERAKTRFSNIGKTLVTIDPRPELMRQCLSGLDLEIRGSEDTTLADIFDSDQFRGNVELMYEYDHGDSWEHQIVLLGRADPALKKAMLIPEDMETACLGGEGHPCAEDCGSEPGWADLKAVFKKGARDPEGKRQWYKTMCVNGDPKGLDPYRWDIFSVNNELVQIKQ